MSDLDQFRKSIDDLPLFEKNVDISYLTCLNTFSEKIFSAFPTQLTCQLFSSEMWEFDRVIQLKDH